MELKDTVELMNSKDYKERFIAEYWQLKIRYEKLKKFCVTIEGIREYNGSLDFDERLIHKKEEPKHDCSLSLLRVQLEQMDQLLHTLEVRAVIEGVDLDKPFGRLSMNRGESIHE